MTNLKTLFLAFAPSPSTRPSRAIDPWSKIEKAPLSPPTGITDNGLLLLTRLTSLDLQANERISSEVPFILSSHPHPHTLPRLRPPHSHPHHPHPSLISPSSSSFSQGITHLAKLTYLNADLALIGDKALMALSGSLLRLVLNRNEFVTDRFLLPIVSAPSSTLIIAPYRSLPT